MSFVIHSSALAAKVAAVNRCNSIANELQPILRAAWAKLEGSKVVKIDNSLLESVKKQLPALPTGERLQVFRDSRSSYSINYTVKVWESYRPEYRTAPGETACYHEVSIYVAKLNGQTCAAWDGAPWQNLRTDYTANEIVQLRKVAEQARQAARDAESALHPFGEYDR